MLVVESCCSFVSCCCLCDVAGCPPPFRELFLAGLLVPLVQLAQLLTRARASLSNRCCLVCFRILSATCAVPWSWVRRLPICVGCCGTCDRQKGIATSSHSSRSLLLANPPPFRVVCRFGVDMTTQHFTIDRHIKWKCKVLHSSTFFVTEHVQATMSVTCWTRFLHGSRKGSRHLVAKHIAPMVARSH